MWNEWLATHVMDPLIATDKWDNEHQVGRLLARIAANLPVPRMLFLSGTDDRRVPPGHTQRLVAHLHSRGAPASAVHAHAFEGSAHSCHGHPHYHERIRAFLATLDRPQ